MDVADIVIVVAVAGALVVLAVVAWRFTRRRPARMSLEAARSSFRACRERLEARFLTLAEQSGMPRGLLWVECDFENDVTFAHDRQTGDVLALVGVTIRFEAAPGGGMEHVEAVSNLRAATAVFRNDGRQWTTQGRSIFNLNPKQTVAHFEMRPVEAD